MTKAAGITGLSFRLTTSSSCLSWWIVYHRPVYRRAVYQKYHRTIYLSIYRLTVSSCCLTWRAWPRRTASAAPSPISENITILTRTRGGYSEPLFGGGGQVLAEVTWPTPIFNFLHSFRPLYFEITEFLHLFILCFFFRFIYSSFGGQNTLRAFGVGAWPGVPPSPGIHPWPEHSNFTASQLPVYVIVYPWPNKRLTQRDVTVSEIKHR